MVKRCVGLGLSCMLLLTGCFGGNTPADRADTPTTYSENRTTVLTGTDTGPATEEKPLSEPTAESGTTGSDSAASDSGTSGTTVFSGTSAKTQTAEKTTDSGSKSTTGRTKTTTTQTAAKTTGQTLPAHTGEFRGVWLSYIELNNLLKSNNTPQKAAAALDAMMDNCVSLHLNAVVFMVRGHSDAYYRSTLFKPNEQAKKLLDAGFDPVEYAIKAAHKRNIAFHAWVNPYRIGKDKSYAKGSDYFYYGDKYYYIPTSEAARKVILDGLRELTDRYEIDGIHFDDYFYPSGCATEKTPMDCEKEAYAAYQKKAGAGAMTPGAWRRNAVDTLVSAAYDVAHRRAGCVFGISPSHDADKTYRVLFADTKKWLAKKGYVDYLCPQVYFGFEHGSDPFDEVVDTWLSYPRQSGVRLYFGLGLYKIGIGPDRYAHTAAGRSEWQTRSDIMKRSVQCLRARKACNGMIFYSYSYFDPSAGRGLASWTEQGTTVKQTYNKAVAQKEIAALKTVL